MCTQFLAENVFLRDTVKIETIYAAEEKAARMEKEARRSEEV
jgi:hypothetical protein